MRSTLWLALAFAFLLAPAGSADEPARRQWTIDGAAREAFVYAPPSAKKEPAPLVFVFHGHGGRSGGRV